MSPGGSRFAETRWTLVLAAGNAASDRSDAALAELCEQYWSPLHAYVRARGYSPEDAKDLTQSFFARLIEKRDISAADPARGRFRAFLLTALKHFLLNEHDRATALKRGGRERPLSLDAGQPHRLREPADEQTPDRIFEQQWAHVLLERAIARAGVGIHDPARQRLLAHLGATLTGRGDDLPLARLAADTSLTEGTVRVTLHRLRKRLRSAIEAEVAETVTSKADAEDEVRHLFAVLSQ